MKQLSKRLGSILKILTCFNLAKDKYKLHEHISEHFTY